MRSRPAEGAFKPGNCSGRSSFGHRILRLIANREYRSALAGVSLVELLVVSAVMVLMAAVAYSALQTFSNSAGRRGAANILLNAFEQARIAALESGQRVYIGFADGDFPVADMRYASFLVFRETSDEERAAGAGNYVVLKKWTRLPKNVAFKRVEGSLVPESGGQTFPGLNTLLPAGQQDETFPSLAFNGSGAVDGGTNPLHLFLYEGYSAGDQDVQRRRGDDLFEKITLSRHTGRAQLDVTTAAVQ